MVDYTNGFHKMTGVIYKLTNPAGQAYIGQTRNLNKRMENYRTLNCKSQRLLYKSLVTYGFNNHQLQILKRCPIKRLDYWEIKFINEHKTCYRDDRKYGLNILKEPYEDYLKLKHKVPRVPGRRQRAIIQCTLFGDQMRVHNNISAAVKALNIPRIDIIKALNGAHYHAGGYTWIYK